MALSFLSISYQTLQIIELGLLSTSLDKKNIYLQLNFAHEVFSYTQFEDLLPTVLHNF
jgi:hypothetical protein